MKTYILQKHLPNLNAGHELTLSCDGERYEIQEDETKHYFSLYKEVVENNEKWFKLKEEMEDKFNIKLVHEVLINGERYVLLEDMKDCFNAARQYVNNNNAISFFGGERFVYLSFQDYKNKFEIK